MVVGGLRGSGPDHTAAVVAYAIDVLNAVKAHRAPNGKHIRLRIGIHHGPTVAGVIGRRKFIYDLWATRSTRPAAWRAMGWLTRSR